MTQVRIITIDGADIGWVQSFVNDGTLFLAQLFIDAPFQRRGIGTEVVNALIDDAARARQAVTLGVVKTNLALRLYKRLGFRITHNDSRKFYMRRECGEWEQDCFLPRGRRLWRCSDVSKPAPPIEFLRRD